MTHEIIACIIAAIPAIVILLLLCTGFECLEWPIRTIWWFEDIIKKWQKQ